MKQRKQIFKNPEMFNFVFTLKSWEEGQKTGKLWVVLSIGENLGEFLQVERMQSSCDYETWLARGLGIVGGAKIFLEKCHYAL